MKLFLFPKWFHYSQTKNEKKFFQFNLNRFEVIDNEKIIGQSNAFDYQSYNKAKKIDDLRSKW